MILVKPKSGIGNNLIILNYLSTIYFNINSKSSLRKYLLLGITFAEEIKASTLYHFAQFN